jgi:predicted small secreted protein
LIAFAPLLTACNTIRSVGEDLSAVGNTLSRAAD